jgi:hypothetical protein
MGQPVRARLNTYLSKRGVYSSCVLTITHYRHISLQPGRSRGTQRPDTTCPWYNQADISGLVLEEKAPMPVTTCR